MVAARVVGGRGANRARLLLRCSSSLLTWATLLWKNGEVLLP